MPARRRGVCLVETGRTTVWPPARLVVRGAAATLAMAETAGVPLVRRRGISLALAMPALSTRLSAVLAVLRAMAAVGGAMAGSPRLAQPMGNKVPDTSASGLMLSVVTVDPAIRVHRAEMARTQALLMVREGHLITRCRCRSLPKVATAATPRTRSQEMVVMRYPGWFRPSGPIVSVAFQGLLRHRVGEAEPRVRGLPATAETQPPISPSAQITSVRLRGQPPGPSHPAPRGSWVGRPMPMLLPARAVLALQRPAHMRQGMVATPMRRV